MKMKYKSFMFHFKFHVSLFVSVSAMLVYTRQKISLKFLFLSDIFLFPFIWQQFPVLT